MTESDPSGASGLAEHGGWARVLDLISTGVDLDRGHAAAAMSEILAGRATPAQIGGLLVGLRSKGASVDEMTGMAMAMLDAAEPLSMPADAIDIVGTGGSSHRRTHALNVSTMSAFVAAGAGAIVCKHGNYRASSTSGSFDFLAALGVEVGLTPSQLETCVDEVGLGFALARTFHPAMRHAGPVRAELGIPTVFNLLGPLAHPARVTRQVIGTPSRDAASSMAEVLHALGSVRALVVAGAGGLDEIGLSGPSHALDVSSDAIVEVEIDPGSLGIEPLSDPGDLAGGTADDNAAIFHRILTGDEAGPRADIVALNAGAGLLVAGVADDLAAGLELARRAITDGSAQAKLDRLVELTNTLGD